MLWSVFCLGGLAVIILILYISCIYNSKWFHLNFKSSYSWKHSDVLEPSKAHSETVQEVIFINHTWLWHASSENMMWLWNHVILGFWFCFVLLRFLTRRTTPEFKWDHLFLGCFEDQNKQGLTHNHITAWAMFLLKSSSWMDGWIKGKFYEKKNTDISGKCCKGVVSQSKKYLCWKSSIFFAHRCI